MTDDTPGRQRRGRIVLIAIAALFIVPMSVAWIWYMNLERIGPPEGTTAKGGLIDPAVPMADFSLPRVDAPGTIDLEALRGRWTMVYIGGQECGEACAETLYDMRQARLALGKDIDRVQRLYLLYDADAPQEPGFFADAHPDLAVARIPPAHPLLAQLGVDGPAARRVWLIDPLGNLMMSYTGRDLGRAMLDDLKRLLRLSRVG